MSGEKPEAGGQRPENDSADRAIQCLERIMAAVGYLIDEGYDAVEVQTGLALGLASWATFLFVSDRIKYHDFERWKKSNSDNLLRAMEGFHKGGKL